MLKTMQSAERDAIFAVADLMAAAAKTAPKGSGRDTIVTAIVSGETKDQLRDKLTELGTKYEEAFMVRDAGNIDNSTCVLLIGCTDTYMGLNHCSSSPSGTTGPAALTPLTASFACLSCCRWHRARPGGPRLMRWPMFVQTFLICADVCTFWPRFP